VAQPAIFVGHEAGQNNAPDKLERLEKARTYEDLSTIMVVPTRGVIPARVVEAYMGLMAPMNQKFTRIFVQGLEVGEAYNAAIDLILAHPELSKWRYVLTVEEDNLPPPDGLLRLFESIPGFAAVGGLYWTKGLEGQPMIYGDPKGVLDFVPQLPQPETVQECNGLGMGFTLFDLDVFRTLERPWFRTLQEYSPDGGARAYTQDLFFFEKARRAGHRIACDTRVRVGHLDPGTGEVW
jgi:hypothetical protein